MIKASICTIGDEILIGQIVDTNSSHISKALGGIGVKVDRMLSIGDSRQEIISTLSSELDTHDIVIATGGLGPTKDDITKDALAELSGSTGYVKHEGQETKIHEILGSRGLDVLDINLRQAMVPDSCEVIVNRLGTAPIMVFRMGKGTLYSLPGVPYEALGALPDIVNDIKSHYNTESIYHNTIMTYGIAESALSKLIEPWEDSLPKDMHLAYLPNQITGVRLRLSIYGGDAECNEKRVNERMDALKQLISQYIYSEQDDNLQSRIGQLLRNTGKTISAAESCTGGEISHLLTTIPGSSEYYLGSVTSYAISVKENVLGVNEETIRQFGIVSEEVAAEMAEGVRRVTGSTYSVSTTGVAGPGPDGDIPSGTVCIGVNGPKGTVCVTRRYHADRERNIERFASAALFELMRYIQSDR